ncbi:hypothetical protein ZIOFF_064635 [Zingiber officinale]|uniref:Uncharacterized protein n=1 Tax=Zingiber officinale TaxID=94328 RepID=A0A8J5EW63_ZINOF|nr:hypothetical protein ZIOFF_064635 [Zingiber officinale]
MVVRLRREQTIKRRNQDVVLEVIAEGEEDLHFWHTMIALRSNGGGDEQRSRVEAAQNESRNGNVNTILVDHVIGNKWDTYLDLLQADYTEG